MNFWKTYLGMVLSKKLWLSWPIWLLALVAADSIWTAADRRTQAIIVFASLFAYVNVICVVATVTTIRGYSHPRE